MNINEDIPSGDFLLTAYDDHSITINGEKYLTHLMLTPNHLATNWTPYDWAPIIALAPKILLLGLGRQAEYPSPALFAALVNAGIGVEAMTTPSACRSFVALAAEGRDVCAALIIGDNQYG